MKERRHALRILTGLVRSRNLPGRGVLYHSFDGCRQNVLFQAGKLVRVLATGHSAQRACKQKERPPTTVEMSSEHKVLIELTDFIPVLYRNQAPRVFHRNGTTDSGSLGTRGNEWYVDTAKVMPEVATDA